MRAVPAIILALALAACSHDGELARLRKERLAADGGATNACRLLRPTASVLVARDDLDLSADGLQTELTVESSRDGVVRVLLDGADAPLGNVTPTATDDGSYRAVLEVALSEGAHTISVECGAGLTAEPRDFFVDTRPCTVVAVLPKESAVITQLDDAVTTTDTLDVAVSGRVEGDDCAQVEVGDCGATASVTSPTRNGLFAVDLPLGANASALCVVAEDAAGNRDAWRQTLTVRRCADDEVLCPSDRQCHDDVATNADACGPDCAVCPPPPGGNGMAACLDGVCAYRCDDGFVELGGACVYRPSCRGLTSVCAAGSCCAADAIAEATGEALRVQRGYDQSGKSTGIVGWTAEDASLAVTVDDFQLDRFEVTVGRFRRFLADYDGWLGGAAQVNPRAGQGQHPAVPASGWQAEWNGAYYFDAGLNRSVPLLPVTSADFSERIGNCAPSTWTAAPSTNETRPINCLNYFEAFLFCIWEGGRLPTEAEWIVAAAGGRQQRAYPWSYPPSDDTLTANAAVYGAPESRGPSDVGSVLAGSGRWGSQDLAGNLFEWTRDTVSGDLPSVYPPGASNPVYLDQDTTLRGLRAVHGGSYKFGPDYMRTPYRQWLGPEVRLNDVGFRCAYPGLNDN